MLLNVSVSAVRGLGTAVVEKWVEARVCKSGGWKKMSRVVHSSARVGIEVERIRGRVDEGAFGR